MRKKEITILGKEPSASFLATPVSALPNVAAARAKLFEQLHIQTVYDLITHFPRDYEDWSQIYTVDTLLHDEVCSFVACVRTAPSLQRKGRLSMLRASLSDESGTIRAVWFNQPYLSKKLEKGKFYFFRGKIRRDGKNFDVTNPIFEEHNELEAKGLRPLYPLTKGMTQGVLSTLIEKTLPEAMQHLVEPLPANIRKEERLCSFLFSYEKIHQPDSFEALEIARKRLIYEELFLIQGGLRWMKMQNQKDELAFSVCLSPAQKKELKKTIEKLPFSLTSDQKNISEEILLDMEKSTPMNRLVQGDVGSGKTVLAAVAAMAASLNKKQSVFMAPTSILAQQHYHTLSSFFEGTEIRVGLLLGSTPAAQKKKIREKLENGEISVLVGTHAVLSKENAFSDLALVITDEQHRFGVRQRGSFFEKGKISPHILVMSATPIPRTLALILYGDLDISVMRERPKGRIPVETYMADSTQEERIHGIVSRQIEEGRQVYYVCPLIEENDEAENELLSAATLYNHLATEIFPKYKVGLLHGSLKQKQKEEVMESFVKGETQILVSTTVIEVGVDNPNASLMIIENADRFGLAQLHQLRGRIGRGTHRSVCILKSEKKEGLSHQRMTTLCKTNDGFIIAQKDLELRGPGDFFGTRQHGIPDMKIANLYRDSEILARVGKAWDKIYEEDPYLENPRLKDTFTSIYRRFGDAFLHTAL